MRSLLKLFAGIFVLVNRTKNGYHFLLGRKRNRSADKSTGLLDRVDDLRRALVDELMIIRLQGDPHNVFCHKKVASFSHFFKSTTSGDCTHTRACRE